MGNKKVNRRLFSRNSILKIAFNLFIFTLIFLSPVVLDAQESESGTKLEFSGSFRTRGFWLGRDSALERRTPNTPVQSPEIEQNLRNQEVQDIIDDETERLKLGLPSGRTQKKENLNIYDTRFLFNMNFATSKYVDGLWGMQVGDINFGSRGLPQPGPGGNEPNIVRPGPTRLNPNTTGPVAGGELNTISAVNVRTNFLFMNFNLPESGFQARVGLQLFSSPGGRVLFATGTGINMMKTFQFLRLTLNTGALRARERSLLDTDNNGFADKNVASNNIGYAKLKMDYFRNYKPEIYSYGFFDNDRTNDEVGELYWHGFYNEFNYSNFSFVIHGVLNTGVVRQFRPVLDADGDTIYNMDNRHFIKGGLYDLSVTYRIDDTTNVSLVGIGTTGRPGFDVDGVEANLKANGYRHLAPGYAISNIGIDFTGGYQLFFADQTSGLNQYGVNYTFVTFGKYQIQLGYFQMYSTLSPRIENNRVFNQANGYNTSTYFGHEYNLNLRWNIFRDLTLIFRSGHFVAGDGLYALFDERDGSFIREAFVTLEHRF
jgi:hypothetical protein